MNAGHNPSPDAPAPADFGPEHRLHSNRDHGRVMHRQQKAAGRHVVVLVRPRGGTHPARLGVMIGAKVVKTSVRRHQLKRWVRELFRTRLKGVLSGHDCIVLFRNDPPADGHHRLDDEITALAGKAVLAPKGPPRNGGGRRR